MDCDRKTNYVFYERKIRDDKEIESLLLQDDERDSEENDEWVVQKSAKKLTPSSKQKNGNPSGSTAKRQQSVKSPSKSFENGIVSPIKIKRKLSYAVTKTETPPKKRPDIVSPILIKRIPTDTVTVIYSPSACRKPTIELTSSDDEEDTKKSKHSKRNKKRTKPSGSSEAELGIIRNTKLQQASPKKRITYSEGSEDDEFELHKAKPSRQMLPRKSKPSKLKISSSDDDEPAVKRTPSRRCKLKQESGSGPCSRDMLPLSSKKRFQTPINQDFSADDSEGSSDEGTDKLLTLPLSSKTHSKGKENCSIIRERTPSKKLPGGTPSKARNNGTPQKQTLSPFRSSGRKNHLDSVTSLVDNPKMSQIGASRVLAALEAVELLGFSPSKSPDASKVNSASSKSVPNGLDTPSKRLVLDSPTKACASKRDSRRAPGEGKIPELNGSDAAASRVLPSPDATESSPSKRPDRPAVASAIDKTISNGIKTPSKTSSPGEVGTPAKRPRGRPAKTPAKKDGLQSADALSQADSTPEKGFTPGKPVPKSTRSTPAKGSTPSKSTTPAKPSSVVIPVSSSEDEDAVDKEEVLATPLRHRYKRAVKSKPPPKVETPLKRMASTPSKTPLRRSARVSMSPSTPSLRQKVLLANTPRSSLPPLKDESESEDEFVTPRKTPRTAKKKLDLTPSTPASCRKVGHGFLSPVVAEREKRGLSTPSSDLDIARAQLQVSTLPKSLPCREKEFSDIENFILRKLKDGTGGCMYVSGVPGTGKTATVHTVIRALQKMAESRELDAFDFVEVNGLRLTEPRQAYVRIWQCLSKNKATPDQSLKHLETKFNGKPKRSTVLLVDELDYLCNRRQDVIYNILDWTTKRYSKLVVLTIANTMDLPERTLKGKVTSRMGLTRLVFQPYNFHQLEEIVLNRLNGCKAFNPDAVQLVARKVAAVSGDARRALDICRRSTEILELEGKANVSVLDIQKVLTQIFAGSRVQAIKNCSTMAKLVLRAIKDEVLRTGVEETTIAFIHPQLVSICALEGKREPTITDLLAICSNLAESGLVFAEKGRKDVNRKISLNVSTDDIHYAINC